jgi:hypothetical protein
MVVGHDRSAQGRPSALFYGHYDVQPVDPLDLWDDDPFDPSIKTRADGAREIRGRGAADDKGQLMTFVEACRAWKAVTGLAADRGHDPARGRGGIRRRQPAALPRRQPDELGRRRADLRHQHVGPADPGDHHHAARLCAEEITIHAADRDLHSGFYGSAAANPNHVLARILADLHDAGAA